MKKATECAQRQSDRSLHITKLLATTLCWLWPNLSFAATAPISVADARRLSIEDPREFLAISPQWLTSGHAKQDANWRREILLRRGRAAWILADRSVTRESAFALEALAVDAQMPLARAYALLLKADESADFGLYEAANADVSAAAEILRATEDPHWQALANTELCDAYWSSGPPELAMRYCRSAEKQLQEGGDQWLLGRVENAISMLLEGEDKDEQAIAVAHRAQDRFRRLQMPSMVAMIDDNLSSLYLERGEPEKALALSENSLKIELAAGKYAHAALSRINIASALSRLGRHKQALASIDEAIADSNRAGLESVHETLYQAQMEVADAAGDLPLALRAARKAIEATAKLVDQQTRRTITEMEARYQAAEQTRAIERLDQQQKIRELELARSQEENDRQAAQLARQNLWLWLVTVTTTALLLVSILMFVLWRASRGHAERMRWLADIDGLTGVLNRRAFVARLRRSFDEHRSGGTPLSLCVVDADYFKRINDNRGHQVGDLALQRLTRLLGADLPAPAALGRIGGEEFALLLPNLDGASALVFADQLRARVAKNHLQADGIGFPMSVSIGVAQLDDPMGDCEAWLIAADQALYRAKVLGRDRCVLYERQCDSPPISGEPLKPATQLG